MCGLHELVEACSCWKVSVSPKVKIMMVNGELLKYEAPICVKQVMMEHPSHALFNGMMVKKMGNRVRPLEPQVYLQPGQVYFLVRVSTMTPSPTHIDTFYTSSASTTLASSFTKTRPSSSQVSSLAKSHTLWAASSSSRQEKYGISSIRAVSRECSFKIAIPDPSHHRHGHEHHLNGVGTTCVNNITKIDAPTPIRSVVRLKVVVSKQEFASILAKAGPDTSSIIKHLLQLEVHATSSSSPSSSSSSSQLVTNQLILSSGHQQQMIKAGSPTTTTSSWKPRLPSIPEYC